MAGALKLPTGAVAVDAGTGNDTMPQCSFSARGVGRGRVEVIANVDTSPQPYFRLERAAIEGGQQFGTVRTVPAPQAVTGLGIEADWFPAQMQLMTTDGVRLITVSVNWRRAGRDRQRALTEAVARTYLRSPSR